MTQKTQMFCVWGIFFFSARSWERRMFWGVFLTADWQLPYEQGSICQHPIWRTAEPLGDGPHGPGMTKLRGCSQPSLGAWPFRVIDPRSKRHFLRGDLWRRWHGRTSLKAYGVKTNTLVLLVEITISVTLITRYNKHTRSSYFKLTYYISFLYLPLNQHLFYTVGQFMLKCLSQGDKKKCFV